MPRLTLTQATAAFMRAHGWVGDVTERRQGPISRDYLGMFDSIWIKRGTRLVRTDPNTIADVVRIAGIQHTSKAHAAHRLAKLKRSPNLKPWLNEGGECWLIAWGRNGPDVTVVESP